MAQRKANLSRIVPVERWRVEEVVHSTDRFGNEVRVPVLRFVEIADDIDRNDVLGPKTPTKIDTAESWLAALLADGEWHESAGVKEFARQAGISPRTVQRAADDLGVEVKREGWPAKTYWALTPVAPTIVAPNVPPEVGATMETAQPSLSRLVEDTVAPTSGDVA